MKSAVETTIWKFCICTDSNVSLNSEHTRTESSSSRTGFVFDFIALGAALLPKKIYEPSGMKAEGHPRARECRECEVIMHEARSDGDLQPVGRDSSKPNAG